MVLKNNFWKMVASLIVGAPVGMAIGYFSGYVSTLGLTATAGEVFTAIWRMGLSLGIVVALALGIALFFWVVRKNRSVG